MILVDRRASSWLQTTIHKINEQSKKRFFFIALSQSIFELFLQVEDRISAKRPKHKSMHAMHLPFFQKKSIFGFWYSTVLFIIWNLDTILSPYSVIIKTIALADDNIP
jgi:hypothetical protein